MARTDGDVREAEHGEQGPYGLAEHLLPVPAELGENTAGAARAQTVSNTPPTS